MMDAIVHLIDEAIDRYNGRTIVTSREYVDVLLDLRLACTSTIEQQKEGGFELGFLPERFDALVGVGDINPG